MRNICEVCALVAGQLFSVRGRGCPAQQFRHNVGVGYSETGAAFGDYTHRAVCLEKYIGPICLSAFSSPLVKVVALLVM